MNSHWLKSLALGCLVLTSSWIPSTKANITITAAESGGNVVFSYSGSLNASSLEPLFGPIFTSVFGEVAPSTSSLYFGAFFSSSPNSVRYYFNPVISAPTSLGTGPSSYPSSFTGSLFFIDSVSVGVPATYVDGTQISGTMTFNATTLQGLGFDTTRSYTWNLASADSVTLIFGSAPSTVNKKAVLIRKLKGLNKRLKQAKKKRQQGLIKKYQKSIASIKKQIAAL